MHLFIYINKILIYIVKEITKTYNYFIQFTYFSFIETK
jgi:hypothetical protein